MGAALGDGNATSIFIAVETEIWRKLETKASVGNSRRPPLSESASRTATSKRRSSCATCSPPVPAAIFTKRVKQVPISEFSMTSIQTLWGT